MALDFYRIYKEPVLYTHKYQWGTLVANEPDASIGMAQIGDIFKGYYMSNRLYLQTYKDITGHAFIKDEIWR